MVGNTFQWFLIFACTVVLCMAFVEWVLWLTEKLQFEDTPMSKKPPQEADESVHRSQEKRNIHPVDQTLRDSGFSIHARREGQPSLWLKEGKIYTEDEARAICEEEEVKYGVIKPAR